MPRYLEAMEEILSQNPDAGLAYARAWVLDEAAGGGRVRRGIWPPPGYVTGSRVAPEDPVVALASGNYVGAVQTATREAVERVGRPGREPASGRGLRPVAEDRDRRVRHRLRSRGARRGPKPRRVALQGRARAGRGRSRRLPPADLRVRGLRPGAGRGGRPARADRPDDRGAGRQRLVAGGDPPRSARAGPRQAAAADRTSVVFGAAPRGCRSVPGPGRRSRRAERSGRGPTGPACPRCRPSSWWSWSGSCSRCSSSSRSRSWSAGAPGSSSRSS